MASVEINIDEILWGLTSWDQKKMLEGLLNDMDPKKVLDIIRNHTKYADKPHQVREAAIYPEGDVEFASACAKVANNRWRLDLTDEEYILKLASKL